MRRFQFTGSRVIKTGVAIFLTAWVCELLNWPPVFAVITAIVTLEPTVSDSIKKGFVRFPASAIGSAYAVLFIALFGNSILTYTLAAVFTIATCSKLRLDAGLLVATITSVAMIEVIHDNYVMAFFVRLGTTTVGLVVSTLINMFIFPPNYQQEIYNNIHRIAKKTGKNLELLFENLLFTKTKRALDLSLLDKLDKKITKTEKLIQFQKDEAKYHPLVGSEKENFEEAEQKMATLKLIHYHMFNLVHYSSQMIPLSFEKKQIIKEAVLVLVESLRKPGNFKPSQFEEQVVKLRRMFWKEKIAIGNQVSYTTAFPPDLIMLYELLSIYDLIESFHLSGKERSVKDRATIE